MPSFTSLAEADSGLAYTFEHGGGIFFRATDVVIYEVGETFAIREWMLEQHQQGLLPRNTLVVTRVLKARSCVILISQSDAARVEMRTAANATISGLELADLQIGAVVTRATGMYASMVLSEGATPLFGGLRVRRDLFRRSRVEDLLLGRDGGELTDEQLKYSTTEDDDDPFEQIGLPE